MRLSSTLRRYRWAVFAVWLLLLVPSIYLALNQSSHLTGGGFEVEGSQSLRVQRELEQNFPDQGASPLALVAAPRADASFDDMNNAVAFLERTAAEVPSVSAAQSERAYRLRTLQNGELRLAAGDTASGPLPDAYSIVK